MNKAILPISGVLPTRNRPVSLHRCLDSVLKQSVLPAELVVIDASNDQSSHEVVERWSVEIKEQCRVMWLQAAKCGAAVQRNQGVDFATQRTIWFFEDDVVLESDCLERLWLGLQSDQNLGGVNAMITNQKYHPPGNVSKILFLFMHGRREDSYAGRIIGPALNLLPEDRIGLPEVVPVEWLNLGCTMYRREALPEPPFDSIFTGYSLMEDVALSLKVRNAWQLANIPMARIYHDSQPGVHKSNPSEIAQMQFVNRHYVMTSVLQRGRILDYIRLFVWELFQMTVCMVSNQTRHQFPAMMWGKIKGLCEISKRLMGNTAIHNSSNEIGF